MTSYLVSSLVWTVVGLGVGYVIGSAGRARMFDFMPWTVRAKVETLEARISSLEERWYRKMAKDKEALARLDAEIAKLRDYIRSDEETDAAEVDKRTEELRVLLAEAQGSGEAPAEEVASREEELSAVVQEARDQQGG